MTVCQHCGAQNAPGSATCGSCGRVLSGTVGPAIVRSRRLVTIVFTDVTDSTALAEALDPEPFREIMDRYFERMRDVLEAHGGTIEKFIGDAVMAVFGIPEVHEDDALRAVRAAVEMRGALGSLNDEISSGWGVRIQTRTGVSTGQVVAGDPSSGHGFATGDTVNVAARLEQAANPGDIVISSSTFDLVRDAVKVEALGPMPLKGLQTPVAAYRLIDVMPHTAGRTRRFDVPMVDRGREASTLREAFERMESDRLCQLVTVLGTPGVGKSRLALEFLGWCRERATALTGRCLPYGEAITFWPLAGVVNAASGITERDPQQLVRTKIANLVAGADHGELVAERVAQAIGAAAGTAPPEETLWAARLFLEILSRAHPLVLVFEDIHWAEPTFLDLIELLVDQSRDAPIMLLCLARPELLEVRPNWGEERANATTIRLEPLEEGDCRALVMNLLGIRTAAPEVHDRIVARSSGLPLFAEEIVSVMIDDGLLAMEGERWVPTGDLSKLAIPPTITGLIAARLDRLQPGERAFLERAAVIGEEFSISELEPVLETDTLAEAHLLLDSLLRKDLLRPGSSGGTGEEMFRFRHILARDVAYDSMPKRGRADLHERYADWLERWAGDRLEEYEEIIASHFERAHRLLAELGQTDARAATLAEMAGLRFAAAGRRAYARSDMPATTKLLGRAISLLPEGESARYELLPDLGRALRESGDFARAVSVLREAIEWSIASEDRALGCHARLIMAEVRAEVDPQGWMELRPAAESAIPVFEALGDWFGLARSWQNLAHDRHVRWQMAAAQDARERAVGYARMAGERREEIEILSDLCGDIQWGPTPADEGIALLEEISAQAPDQPTLEACVLGSRAALEAMRGRFDQARALYAQARSIREGLGLRLGVASIAQVAWVVEMIADRPREAERELRRAHEMLRGMGDQSYFYEIVDMLAQAVYAQGRYREADELATITERSGMNAEDPSGQIGWRRIRAKVLARSGLVDEAERLAREALAVVGSTDLTNDHADAAMDLAEVLQLAGRQDDAAPVVAKAIRLYDGKGNKVSAAKARRLLGSLSA